MSAKMVCACDRTCEKLISTNLNVLDTVHVPFPAQVEALSDIREAGFWISPFRGIPRGPRLSRFDVIYLDEACRVIACSENFTEVEFQPILGKISSVIVLPAHTISSVRMKAGDQFRICKDGRMIAGAKEIYEVGESVGQEIRCANNVVLHH